MIKAMLFALFVVLLMVGCGESSQPSESTEMNSTAPESPNPSGVVDMTDTAPKKDAIETAVDWSKLQDRSGVTYLPNTDKPFSGYAKRAYENEQIEVLAQFKDGYVVRVKQWQENGTPRWDVGYMEGKVGIEGMPYKRPKAVEYAHGPATLWHENGQKKGEGNWKDGERHGPATYWYENGQKQKEGNWKDGKLDGLATDWYENGQKAFELTYKDGKLMSAVAWKPNGEKCPETNVKDGNGVWVLYNEDGTEWKRDTYKDGEIVED